MGSVISFLISMTAYPSVVLTLITVFSQILLEFGFFVPQWFSRCAQIVKQLTGQTRCQKHLLLPLQLLFSRAPSTFDNSLNCHHRLRCSLRSLPCSRCLLQEALKWKGTENLASIFSPVTAVRALYKAFINFSFSKNPSLSFHNSSLMKKHYLCQNSTSTSRWAWAIINRPCVGFFSWFYALTHLCFSELFKSKLWAG